MKIMLIVLGIMLLCAAAAYFIENAYENRKRLRDAARAAAAAKLSPEEKRMAEMEKLSALFSDGVITRDEFDRIREELMKPDNSEK
ncbi:MAG: SHOCT domain-containing protein [Ruminococcus sp.]|nr:SHOCT domain-containing protein [Ruminococcus sp.]